MHQQRLVVTVPFKVPVTGNRVFTFPSDSLDEGVKTFAPPKRGKDYFKR